MKIKIISIVFFLAFSSAFMSAQENPQNTTESLSPDIISTTIVIEGMACQEGCANTISKNLLEMEGVDTAEVSYETGEAIVTFDNNLLTINKLQKAITDTKVKDYVYTVKEIHIINKTEE